MTASTMTTRTAGPDELAAVTELCLAAFADEAVTAWIMPDPSARQEYLRQMFSASLEAAITAGFLILAVDRRGVPVGASLSSPGFSGG